MPQDAQKTRLSSSLISFKFFLTSAVLVQLDFVVCRRVIPFQGFVGSAQSGVQFAFSSNSTAMGPGSSNILDTDSMGTADTNSTGVEAGSNPARKADPQTHDSNSSGNISDPTSNSSLINPDDTIRPEPPNPAPPSNSPSPSASAAV